jgi:hypothetical protein
MPDKYWYSNYDLRLSDLIAVAALVGVIHYLSSLLGDYHSAASVSGAINSANVGVTAAVGALTLTAYRFFRPMFTRHVDQ